MKMIVKTKSMSPLSSYETEKSQLFELQVHLERYCILLPVFGFNSSKDDLNLIKSFLLPILVNKRDIERTVLNKAK